MTVDEAIKQCEELAELNEEQAQIYKEQDDTMSYRCYKERAKEHRQLADWLKALKEIWDSGDCNDCRNGQCEWKPKLGQLVRFNCPYYVGVENGEVNADADSD